ncbi:methyl-accepting chemotaxis protein [Marinospirillum insulare]|uniref:Methyl-accepting chemotaxis protein n=1 Tax=Marinospirillum insulare TaxID=217169 RepID=A0ABQ6A1Y8_9GAMM|nr:methyl-accepting chemotaxis protein [Marinospirillum insulare]GLR64582.1 hypothetical protein GCM10007878_20200 [Marinospirillum insulare]
MLLSNSLRNKLIATASVSTFLLVLVLGLTLLQMHRAEQRFIEFIDRDEAAMTQLNSMLADGLLAGIAIRNKLMNPSLKQPRKVTEGAIQRVNNNIIALQDVYSTDAAWQNELKELNSRWLNNQKAKLHVLTLIENNQLEEAEVHLVKVEHPGWFAIRNQLQDLVKMQRDRFTTTRSDIVAQGQEDLALALGLALASMIIGGALLLVLSHRMVLNLRSTVRAMKQLDSEKSDLNYRLPVRSGDEVGQLAQAFNAFMERLQQLVVDVSKTSHEVREQMRKVAETSTRSSNEISNQRAETDQVATAMTEMSASVHEVASHASEAADAGHRADAAAQEGQEVVARTVHTINQLADEIGLSAAAVRKLNEDSQHVTEVLEVINSVAEQTNLLALNAAIEAARAGEHGRGFAVVADEVRSLAERTRTSTQEIQTIIDQWLSQSMKAVEAMEASQVKADATIEQASLADAALSEINLAVQQIHQMSIQIASAAEEQSSVAEDISQRLVEIDTLADTSADSALETRDAGEAAQELSRHLRDLVERFKI